MPGVSGAAATEPVQIIVQEKIIMKSPLAVIAPSSHDANKGSAKAAIAGLGGSVVVLLEQFTSLPHDSCIALYQVLAALLVAMGGIDMVKGYVNGKKQ